MTLFLFLFKNGSHKTVPIHNQEDQEIVLGKCPDCDIEVPPAMMCLHYLEAHKFEK